MPPYKFINADTISTNDDVFLMQALQENESKKDTKHDYYVSPTAISNLEIIETMSNTTELSLMSGRSELDKSRQFIRGNEITLNCETKDKFKDGLIDHNAALTKQNIEENNAMTKYSSKLDHVYEEVNTLECDIMDYYEKYSPTTAKTLINTLFLPLHKICKKCASLQGSPVYSDRLIYAKKPLYAREVHLFQQNETLQFKYCSENGKHDNTLYLQYDDIRHCLLVHNYLKTNASSIFYFYGLPRDIFDLKTILKPNILVINNNAKEIVNTELYHRCTSNFYTRISSNGIAPTAFHMNHNNILNSIKHVGYDTDLQNWINYRNDVFRAYSFKQNDVIDHRANRSSLLLLEPLLLMPELGNSRYRQGKNRTQSEHVKIVKIVIAYTLSFFILAVITFYIVYFT